MNNTVASGNTGPMLPTSPLSSTSSSMRHAASGLSLFAIAAVGVAWPVEARAQEREVPAQSTPAPRKPIVVQIDLPGSSLDPGVLREAVSREIGAPVVEVDPGDARGTLHVRSGPGGRVEVAYEPRGSAPLVRWIQPPGDDACLQEMITLLSGNLVRSEADELLAELRSRRAAAGPVAAPPPAAEEPPVTEPKSSPPEEEKPLHPVNVAFFHPIAFPQSEDHRYVFELGLLYSRIGGLDGVGVGGGVTWVHGRVRGALADGIGTWVEGDSSGANAAGVFAGGGDLDGARAAGVVAWSGDLEGAQASGVLSRSQKMDGVQAAGVAAVASDDANGVLVAGATSVAGASFRGVQLSGVANVTGGEFDGFQLSVVNVASGKVRGVQLGIVNVAEEVDGLSLGLASFAKNIRVQGVAWWSSTIQSNIAAKFTNGRVYTQTSFGYEYEDAARHRVAAGLSLGYHQALGDVFFVDADGGYWHESELGENSHVREEVVRYRVMGGASLLPWLEVFAGGGLRQLLPTEGRDVAWTPEAMAGVQLF